MPGGKVETVEQIGNVMLCRYGSTLYPGWAVFAYRPTKADEPDWKSICNGRFDDVIKKYVDTIKRSV